MTPNMSSRNPKSTSDDHVVALKSEFQTDTIPPAA